MKTQVDIKDEYAMHVLRGIAIKNGRKISKPDLINMAIEIAIAVVEEKSFEQIVKLKK